MNTFIIDWLVLLGVILGALVLVWIWERFFSGVPSTQSDIDRAIREIEKEIDKRREVCDNMIDELRKFDCKKYSQLIEELKELEQLIINLEAQK